MALKSTVKVSHLSNLSDARFCSGMGVELLGFGAIADGPHYMPPAAFQEIRGWLAGPSIVAELYGISSLAQIPDILQTYAPDYLELSWQEYEKFGKDLSLPCIVDISGAATTASFSKDENIAYVIAGESTTCGDIVEFPFPVLVRTQSMQQLEYKMKASCFAGYVFYGPHQERAGVTSYDELGVLLELLEED